MVLAPNIMKVTFEYAHEPDLAQNTATQALS